MRPPSEVTDYVQITMCRFLQLKLYSSGLLAAVAEVSL